MINNNTNFIYNETQYYQINYLAGPGEIQNDEIWQLLISVVKVQSVQSTYFANNVT